jgi:hypothetical protein
LIPYAYGSILRGAEPSKLLLSAHGVNAPGSGDLDVRAALARKAADSLLMLAM